MKPQKIIVLCHNCGEELKRTPSGLEHKKDRGCAYPEAGAILEKVNEAE